MRERKGRRKDLIKESGRLYQILPTVIVRA